MTISSTEEIIAEIKAGRMVVLVDEEDRENEGDLVMAAEFVTPEAINFMIRHARGLVCLTLTEERCRQLDLPLMVSANKLALGTNFTVSIEAAEGVTTGISASDRAKTILAAVKKDAKPTDLNQPGHIFPLKAQKGGVLVRAGHTEAGCDLAAMAGVEPAAVICEIIKEDGEMARLPDLLVFAKEHGLKIGTIADLIHYRSQNERLVERAAERTVNTCFGEFKLIGYKDKTANEVHLALVKGDIVPGEEVLVRVHEPLSVLDLLDSHSLDHAFSVPEAMKAVAEAGKGVIILMRRTETGGDLLERLQRSEPKPASKVDLRNYGIGAQILRDLNVTKMRLLAVPRKMPSMTGFDLEVTGYQEPKA
ncbi:MAG: bifunctional 3,4-dihydroxy-2-butanone-4-phosphate synthase/GTP cyclohydrolase II [Sulfuricellaceae bacterium]|jgi:3,4-dihydroxy 2-butanone 4-phosphate synthase/GTP cyclohydrolase II